MRVYNYAMCPSSATLRLASQGSSLSGAYNRCISDFAIAPTKFPPLRSGTSDMPRTLYDIPPASKRLLKVK